MFANGSLLGTYDANSDGFHYAFADWLGTKRVQYSLTAGVEETCSSLPYGDSQSCSGSDATNLHYTGKERDTESGNDYFGARYYASTMGRFLSPDYNKTGDEPEPVSYADFEDPQSLNLYAYVRNNPLSRRDSTGHDCDPDTVFTNANGDTVVTAGACHYDWSTFMAAAVGIGHHYIPQQAFQRFDQAGNAYKLLNKVTTGALKNGRLSNSYDKLHRALNRQVDKLLRDTERDLGKSAEDFERGDWEKFGERLEMAGDDIQAFNERLASLEPEARTFGDAFAEALEEVFPAAAEAGAATAEAAAESGVVPF